METSVLPLIILAALSGRSHGVGVLPNSLIAAAGGTVTFTTTLTPPQTPFLVVSWDFSGNGIITSSADANITDPAYIDRISLFRSTASLELRNLTLSNSGEYTVLTITDSGVPQKGICKLVVHDQTSGCSIGCITGSVIACLAVCGLTAGGGYGIFKKKLLLVNNKAPPQYGNKEEEEKEEVYMNSMGYDNSSIDRFEDF